MSLSEKIVDAVTNMAKDLAYQDRIMLTNNNTELMKV